MLSKIQKAYESRDLEALDALAKPTFREQNKNQKFTAALMLSANKIKHLQKIPKWEMSLKNVTSDGI